MLFSLIRKLMGKRHDGYGCFRSGAAAAMDQPATSWGALARVPDGQRLANDIRELNTNIRCRTSRKTLKNGGGCSPDRTGLTFPISLLTGKLSGNFAEFGPHPPIFTPNRPS
jgi:hypothetical protein